MSQILTVGFMKMLRNLTLRATISLLVVASVVVSAAILFGVISWRVAADVADDAINHQHSSIAIVAALAEKEIPTAHIEWGKDGSIIKVTADAIPQITNHDPIDLAKHISQSAATIFAYDKQKDDFLRVTTSILKSDGSRAIGTYLGKDSPAYAVVKSGQQYAGEATILGRPHYTVYQPVVSADGHPVVIIFAGVDRADVAASANRMISQVATATVVVLLLILPVSLWASQRLVRPIPILAKAMTRLAADELDTTIPYADRRTELGDMGRAVAVFRDAALLRRKLLAEQQADAARKDRRRLEMEAAIAKFRSEISVSMTAVTSHLAALTNTAKSVDAASRQTATDADAAANASLQAAHNVENVASAAEELASSINEITEQVSRTSTIVGDAARTTEDANSKVSRLAESASKIGEVVTLIQTIAAQTNLLALNATIEAARAGEAGRGFAVVASEVKNLATQTATATTEIAAQVSRIQSETQTAVDAIKHIAATMDQVNSYTSAIAAAVEEQGAATVEISKSISEASTRTRLVNLNIGTVAETVGATINSAKDVDTASHEVAMQSNALRESIDEFMRNVAG